MAVASSHADGILPGTQQQFEWLRRRFAAGLPARWLDVSQAADAALLQGHLHRLSGSAGSFGFERLGCLAREAELHCVSGDALALAATLNQIDTEIRAAATAMPS